MKGLSLIDLREYVAILRRFGFFDELPTLANGDQLPHYGSSARLNLAQRG